MRNYILILLTIYTLPVFSQVNFPDSNAIWNVNTIGSTGTPKGEILYGLKGDTLINDTLYYKLYLLADTTLENKNFKEYLGGFHREGLKVWFRPKYWYYPNILLYDFSAEVGDTVWHNGVTYNVGYSFEPENYCYSVFFEIRIDDSFKIYNIANPIGGGGDWIEGIGSKNGLFGHISPRPLSGSGDYCHLACFKQNDTVRYQDNLLCDKCFCSFSTNIENESNIDWVTIFPNPAGNSLSIKVDRPYAKIEVEILDEKGTVVYSAKSLSNPINIANMPTGIYFTRLMIDDKVIVKKILINN